MNSAVVALCGIIVLVIGYRFVGGHLSRLLDVDPGRITPAVRMNDGVDYVPAKNWLVLFGHHFSSIAGAGPIIGPVIAVVAWGWGPALIWVLLGTIFIGGVHDFVSTVISLRQDGQSIADVSGEVVSPRARWIFSFFVVLGLILVIAVFAQLCAKTFVTQPKIVLPSLGLIPLACVFGFAVYHRGAPLGWSTLIALVILSALLWAGQFFDINLGPNAIVIWNVVLLAYCFAASVLPVNILLQPRDYLSSLLLVAGLGAGLLGIFVSRPVIVQPAFLGWSSSQGTLWPMMCVTIACGAVSGFHALIASGTTSKQMASESHAQRIGYGAMVVESLVALVAIIAVTAGISKSQTDVCSLLLGAGPICVFGEGYQGLTARILGPYGLFIAITILNVFILTTLDTATRVCRYVVEELTGIKNRYLLTAVVVAASAILAFSGAWDKVWPVFGASNQLIAALTLLVASCWLATKNKENFVTVAGAAFMLVTTAGALGFQVVEYLRQGNYLLTVIAFVLLGLAGWIVAEVMSVLRRKRRIESA